MLARVALGFWSVLLWGCGPAVDFAGGPEEETNGSRHDIVGGAATSAFPAAGALTRYGSAHCTGTLIGPRKVLTAAHCLEGVSAASLKFVIGPSIAAPEAVIPVASVTAHPSYDAASISHDIGYVTLAQDAPVAPMNVASGMDSSWKGKELTFVGYGITNKNGAGAGVKRSVVMPIASVSATTFSYQTVGKNTCNGDSGGPAFAKLGNDWVVAGVTSYGDVGCTQYGVDTRADAYASFLAETPSSGGGAGDPCQGETYEGRCDGDTVIWCEQQSVHQQSCATQSKACGFDTAKGYYACVVADPCHGETYEGRCDGNTVIWCENEQVKQLACTSCGYDGAKGYYNCQ